MPLDSDPSRSFGETLRQPLFCGPIRRARAHANDAAHISSSAPFEMNRVAFRHKLDDARADYETLGQTYTNSFRIDYGLGEIAWRQHATNDAIKYYKLYLANANTNTAEATNVIQRLRQLGGKSP